ncbi:MAG: helix-turn-helix transcriptional regulator [Ardenticatenaceae bacterium]|nr:helix-turn-helix transcriptional regulator [Ardenticatenaceae bacterium]
MSPQLLDVLLRHNGPKKPDTFADIDPNLIPLIEDIANEEGLSIAETVNRLLSFAIGEHHATNDNLFRWDSLTPRQQDTAAFACLGYSNMEIAQKMSISVNTVKTHLRQVLQTFAAGTKGELQMLLASWDFSDWKKQDPHLDSSPHTYPDMR